MAQLDSNRPTVLIMHTNWRVARILDAALRLRFDVYTLGDVERATDYLEAQIPDVILCELAAVLDDRAGPFRDRIAQLDKLQTALVLLTRNGAEDQLAAARLNLPAVGCISESTTPQLLTWQVGHWVRLKRFVDRLRESDTRIREQVLRVKELTGDEEPDTESSKTEERAFRRFRRIGASQATPTASREMEGGSIPKPTRGDSADGLLWASRLMYLMKGRVGRNS